MPQIRTTSCQLELRAVVISINSFVGTPPANARHPEVGSKISLLKNGAGLDKPTLLIFCYSGLGNIIMFLPAFHLLRKGFPDSRVVVVFDDRWYGDPFFATQFGDDVETIRFPLAFSRSPLRLVRSLIEMRRTKPDVALMPFSGNSPKLGAYLLLSGAEYVPFFSTKDRFLNRFFKPCLPMVDNVHYIERNFELARSVLRAAAHEPVPESWIIVNDRLRQIVSEGKRTVWVGFQTGVNKEFNSARQWPLKYYRIILERLIQRGGCLPILFGRGETEVDEIIEISRGLEKHVKLILNRPLTEVAAYIKSCDLFVGNDSGLMNLSVGVGTKTIAIIGPTNPRHTGPYGPLHEIVRLDLPCSPCFDTGYSPKCPHRNCLALLSPDLVWRAVEKSLESVHMKPARA